MISFCEGAVSYTHLDVYKRQLQNQFRIGFSRMERVIRERMTLQSQDQSVITPQALIKMCIRDSSLSTLRPFVSEEALNELSRLAAQYSDCLLYTSLYPLSRRYWYSPCPSSGA